MSLEVYYSVGNALGNVPREIKMGLASPAFTEKVTDSVFSLHRIPLTRGGGAYGRWRLRKEVKASPGYIANTRPARDK